MESYLCGYWFVAIVISNVINVLIHVYSYTASCISARYCQIICYVQI